MSKADYESELYALILEEGKGNISENTAKNMARRFVSSQKGFAWRLSGGLEIRRHAKNLASFDLEMKKLGIGA